MKITVSKPIRAIQAYRNAQYNYTDIEAFYNALPPVLDSMGADYRIIDTFDTAPADTNVHLAWHGYGNEPNTWYIKSGYLPNYFYFDKTGYSGWSTLVHNYDFDVSSDVASEYINAFQLNSRMPQPEHTEEIGAPYVLVLGQKWRDKVLEFSYFENDLLKMVTDLYAGTEYKVVFKPHPLNKGEEGSRGNLTNLIAGANAIYTINSGSGFEALFQHKRVFTTGVSDYHWGTTELKTVSEFQNSINMLEEPVDIDRINKFLYYCLTEYFMYITDAASIQRKIRQAISEA